MSRIAPSPPVSPRPLPEYSPDQLLTPLSLLDLLQESNSCTGRFAPRALAFTRRPLHRDRLVHECDRASYRGGLLSPILMDDNIDRDPNTRLATAWKCTLLWRKDGRYRTR